MISSKDNNKIKRIKKLLEKSKFRREEKAFVLEGFKPVEEALRLGLAKEIYFSESVCEDTHFYYNKYRDLTGYISENNNGVTPGVEVVTTSLFQSISDVVTEQGILAVVGMPEYENEAFFEREDCKLLCLEEVRDPGNIGTMIRTAEAAGFDAILLSPGCADVYQPKVVRSTAGAILRMPCLTCNNNDFIGQLTDLKQHGFTLYATLLQRSVDFKEPTYDGRLGVMIGNEANGLSDEATSLADIRVKIPMQGNVESLNAAVSAALLMYEVNRH
ncbi:MAG: RNA methyltransferase [Eubacterium sp.]|nr:RNA methyltransferase [Eubacterium sp.]